MKRNSLIAGIIVAVFFSIVCSVNQVQAQSTSTSVSINNGVHKYSHRSGSQRLSIEYDGEIKIADDDKSIESISRGGYLLIRKTSFGERREILAEPSSSGVSYEYRVGRRVQEWNQEAQEFLADVLLDVIRTTGIGAESRVERFFKKGRLNGVLGEVDNIRNDHIKHVYLKIMLDEYELNDQELVKLAQYVPSELDSDHYISEVFKDHRDKFLKNDATTNAFLGALRRMDSDHYVTQILTRALREDLNDDALIKVIEAADVMDSDHYKTNVLKEVLDRRDLSDKLVDAVIKASTEIDSDHYATLIISDALDRPNLSDEAFNNLMDAISRIDSDHYVTQTFQSMLRDRDVSDKVIEAILNRLEYMDSDHYRNVIISDLFERQSISSEHFTSLLNTVDDIDSDHYASQILMKVLRNNSLNDAQYDQVLRKVEDIDSDHYKVVIIKDVLGAKLTEKHLMSILDAAESIDSDYYKSEVLKNACNLVQDASDDVKSTFRTVARGIRSDTYYGRVARCID